MALSKERKVYCSVLALGLAALVLDRSLQGGPAAASAADLLVASGATAHAPATTSPPAPGFPARLRERSESLDAASSHASDAFAVPASWLNAKASTADEDQPAPAETADPRVAELVGKLTLGSVMGSAERGFDSATINGTPIRKGEGFELGDKRAARSQDQDAAPLFLEEIGADFVQVRVAADNSLHTIRLKNESLTNGGRLQTRPRQQDPHAGR